MVWSTLQTVTNMHQRLPTKCMSCSTIALIRDRMYVVQENGGMCYVMRCSLYLMTELIQTVLRDCLNP